MFGVMVQLWCFSLGNNMHNGAKWCTGVLSLLSLALALIAIFSPLSLVMTAPLLLRLALIEPDEGIWGSGNVCFRFNLYTAPARRAGRAALSAMV